MSEYERPERLTREVTVADIRALSGASTPHFALQLRVRIKHLIDALAPDHPARVAGERELARLDQIAHEGELRGPSQPDERELPSIRPAGEPA